MLAVEGGVRKKQKRSAGVHDAVCVLAQVVRGLADQGDAAQVLPDGLDAGKRSVEQLLVLHGGENLLDEDMLGNAQICRVIENVVDPAQQPHHQRLNQVGVLLVVHALEVEALQPGERELVFHVVKDGAVNTLAYPLREIAL